MKSFGMKQCLSKLVIKNPNTGDCSYTKAKGSSGSIFLNEAQKWNNCSH